MKRIWAILMSTLILLLVGTFLVYGRDVKVMSGEAAQSAVVKAQRDSMGPRFYTHPEFNNVMTANVTTAANDTEDGYIFVAAMGLFFSGQRGLMILDDLGEPIYIKNTPNSQYVTDFKKQRVNGVDYLVYHVGEPTFVWTNGTHYVMDESYTVVDSWTVDNGNGADEHEIQLLDNGNALLLSYGVVPYDLSPYGGPVDGSIVDIVIQEQDSDKNVVFEWVGSEHIPVADTYNDLTTTTAVDYLHTNAIEVDVDGHLLISNRNTSDIVKINRQTGAVIWRLGGRQNEFTFTNDMGFWRQHDIRRLENGNISLFDNGNGHTPPHSRAVEYEIDEVNKTVTRVWQYPDDTSEYSFIMSNFQRLPGGNSFIGWGGQPQLSEVKSDGSLALEMVLEAVSYRAFRYTWQGVPAAAPRAFLQSNGDPTAATLYTSWNGATDIIGYDVYAGETSASLTVLTTTDRTGFETMIPLTGLDPNFCFFQIKPVHANGISAPLSNMIFRADLAVCQARADYIPLVFRKE